MANAAGTLYLPDLLDWEGRLQAGLALEVTSDGVVAGARAPREGEDAVRLRGRALLPGLVNAHSHAFQRLIRGRTEYVASGHEADDFWSWREQMYQVAEALDPEGVYTASRQAFVEMALAGITTVGEFHYLHHTPTGSPYADPSELALRVVKAARDVGLRLCLLRVGYARAGHQVPANPRQRRFLDPDVDTFLARVQALRASVHSDPLTTVGIAPHSVRAVPSSWLTALAGSSERVVHMHVAEQPAEIRACVAEHARRPVELLGELGLLRPGFTAVHAVHLEAKEVAALGSFGAVVCACPSTERNLGDGIVRADELLAAGAELSLGSDSQAQIDLLAEARQLESHLRLLRLRRAVLDPGGGRRDGLARRLLHFATRGGAAALSLPVGTLAPGSPADFFTVDLGAPHLAGATPDALVAALVFGADRSVVREVAVQGRLIVRDGAHALTERSARDFRALSGSLFGAH